VLLKYLLFFITNKFLIVFDIKSGHLEAHYSAVIYIYIYICNRGTDKSLARPGRKQATATEDFDVYISYL